MRVPNGSSFAERLAYVRWLRNRGRVPAETDGAFAAFLGVTAAWLSKWKLSADPPRIRDQIRAIMNAVHPMGVSEPWLLDGEGHPPEPDRWDEWRRDREAHEKAAAQAGRGTFYGKERTAAASKSAPAKKVSGDKRRPSR